MKYEAVLFDVGDTLVRYVPSEQEQFRQRLTTAGCREIAEEEACRMVTAAKNAEYTQLLREWKGAPRMPDDDYFALQDRAALRCVFSEEESEYLLPALTRQPRSYDGKRVVPQARALLETLQKIGQRMGVVSNDSPRLQAFLDENDLSDFFEVIVISGIVGVEKPDVRIMQVACEKLLVDPARCLYVGDHPFDVLCAKHAGLSCAWIAPKGVQLPREFDAREDFRIDSISKVLALLD